MFLWLPEILGEQKSLDPRIGFLYTTVTNNQPKTNPSHGMILQVMSRIQSLFAKLLSKQIQASSGNTKKMPHKPTNSVFYLHVVDFLMVNLGIYPDLVDLYMVCLLVL